MQSGPTWYGSSPRLVQERLISFGIAPWCLCITSGKQCGPGLSNRCLRDSLLAVSPTFILEWWLAVLGSSFCLCTEWRQQLHSLSGKESWICSQRQRSGLLWYFNPAALKQTFGSKLAPYRVCLFPMHDSKCVAYSWTALLSDVCHPSSGGWSTPLRIHTWCSSFYAKVKDCLWFM